MRAKFINEIKVSKGSGLDSIGVGKIATINKIKKWLSDRNIFRCELDDELFINCNGDVDISDEIIGELPEYINFKFVKGDFDCSECHLTTLRGCPERVEGSFGCQSNNLINLEGGPKYVGESYHCNHNQLTSLKGAPEHVGYSFFCLGNKLKTLEGGPKHVEYTYDCSDNELTSLKGIAPVLDRLTCDANYIKNFDDGPKTIKSEISAENPITQNVEEIERKYGLVHYEGTFHFVPYYDYMKKWKL